jgi:hypothetical protein
MSKRDKEEELEALLSDIESLNPKRLQELLKEPSLKEVEKSELLRQILIWGDMECLKVLLPHMEEYTPDEITITPFSEGCEPEMIELCLQNLHFGQESLDAILAYDIESLPELEDLVLEKGANPKAYEARQLNNLLREKTDKGLTPEERKAVEELIEGMDPHCHIYNSAFYAACYVDQKIALKMIEKGLKVTIELAENTFACTQGKVHPDLMPHLLRSGANTRILSFHKAITAARENDTTMTKFHLEMAGLKDAATRVLTQSSRSANAKTLQFLLDEGAKIQNDGSPTPLSQACLNRNTEAVAFLLSKGAHPELERNLAHAIRKGDVESCKLLYKAAGSKLTPFQRMVLAGAVYSPDIPKATADWFDREIGKTPQSDSSKPDGPDWAE